MSTGSTPENTRREKGKEPASDAGTASGGGSGAGPSVPVASDRPVVHGSARSADELAAEAEELSDERRQEVDQLRAEVGATVTELAGRLDIPARARARKDETTAAVQMRTRTAVAAVRRRVDHLQARAPGRSAAVVRAVRERRALAGAAAVAVLVALFALGRYARGSGR
jgi:hypothetical protein